MDEQNEDSMLATCAITQQGTASSRQVALQDRKLKSRIVRLSPPGQYPQTIQKSYNLDEIKQISLEPHTDHEKLLKMEMEMSGKSYVWTFETCIARLEFMCTLLMLVSSYKKQPRIVGFDVELLNAQLDVMVRKAANLNSSVDDEFEGFDENDTTNGMLEQWIDLDIMLQDFQWDVGGDASALEQRFIMELQALEKANVHDVIQSEERADAVVGQASVTLSALGEIEEWLARYTKLLGTMGQDVHQIEAQNKGMQVTTDNQRELYNEVEGLLTVLNVEPQVLQTILSTSLDKPSGIQECQSAITKIMKIIRYRFERYPHSLLSITEQIQTLQTYANNFARRLYEFLDSLLKLQSEKYLNDKSRQSQRNALKLHGHEALELRLYHFRPLVTWLKEMDSRIHYDLQVSYIGHMSKSYHQEIQDFLEQLKIQHLQRRLPTEDMNFLFSHQQSSNSSASQVLKPYKKIALKQSGHNRTDSSLAGQDDDIYDDKMTPDDAFGHALLKLGSIMVREHNFLVDFFGLLKKQNDARSSLILNLAQSNETEVLAMWQSDLNIPHEIFKDPKAEKRIAEILLELFNMDEVKETLLMLVDVGLRQDSTYSVGMMVHIEFHLREYSNTCHIAITSLLESLHKKVMGTFERFISDQIKGIEEYKVSSKKRSGVLGFIKIFPRFVDRVEAMLATWDGLTRKTVDLAYAKIIRFMFEVLEQCAASSSNNSAPAAVAGVGADEKDSLNLFILTIENMHHFFTETRARKCAGLDEFVRQAKYVYEVNLEGYCQMVIRKPLGKLLEFFEGIEVLLKSGPSNEVSFHVQYSKSALKEVLKRYPGKEIRKSLEVLYKRVDKHFTEDEGLLQVVWRSIQEEFARLLRKYEDIIGKCYPESNARLDFSMEELLEYFSDMASKH